MSITAKDIESFSRFASAQVGREGAESLADLVADWELQRREYEETVAAIRRGQADYEAGKGKLVAEAFADIRKELGLDK